MAELKKGDTVLINNERCSDYVGEKRKIVGIDDDGEYILDGIDRHDETFEERELEKVSNNKENIMSNIVSKIKALALSKEDKVLQKTGLVSDCGELTDDGKEVLFSVLLDEYKTKLAEKAQQVVDEEKGKK